MNSVAVSSSNMVKVQLPCPAPGIRWWVKGVKEHSNGLSGKGRKDWVILKQKEGKEVQVIEPTWSQQKDD